MNRADRRQRQRAQKAFLRTLPETLERMSPAEWPPSPPGWTRPIAVWRSRHLVALVYAESAAGCVARISVRRAKGQQDINWDMLQQVKREVGYGECFAVEAYPEDEHVKTVAPMRHLWVLDAVPPWAWRSP